jgi:DNA uptake protein ComE-like DNA-binding protein
MLRKQSMFLAIAAMMTLTAATVALAQSSSSTMPSTGSTSAKSHSTTTTHPQPRRPRSTSTRASKEELMKLPGVNEATAEKIIAARAAQVEERPARRRHLVTKAEYNKLASHVIVKAEPKK